MKNNSYGLKEVADVKLYRVNPDVYMTGLEYDEHWHGRPLWSQEPGDPVFIFDSLKVSNIEVASEETTAKGGKGNPELISWSYGKTATLNITDALISMQTLSLMFGSKEDIDDINNIVTIDATSFPDWYTIVGTTVLRRYTDGQDVPFVFYIPKAAIQVGGTLTMETEGDPSTFEMTIKALSQDIGDQKNVLMQLHCIQGVPGRVENLVLNEGTGESSLSFEGNFEDSQGTTIPFDDSVTVEATVNFAGSDYDVSLGLVEEE